MRARTADLLLRLTPLLIGLPVLVAIVSSVIRLVGLDHPFFADVSGTSIDAHSLYLGNALYQDPNAGYTPLAYPPLFPLLIAGLDHLRLWTGWPVLVSIAAEAALMGLAARLAHRRIGDSPLERAIALAGAVGVGALAWWLVAFVPFNFLYAPRTDHLSWALAFFGLALVPAAAGGSRRGLAASVLLLTAACWTKQTAAIAPLAGLGGLVVAAGAGRAPWRTAATFAVALAALNAVLFAILDLATAGWAWKILVDMPSRHARGLGLRESTRQLLESIAAPLTLVAGLAAALSLWGPERSAPVRRRLWPEGWEGRFAVVLAMFVVLDALPSAYFRGAEGAAHNVFLGVAWALGLLVAAGVGFCAGRRATLIAAAIAILGLFAVSESHRVQRRLREAQHILVPAKSSEIYVAPTNFPGLRAYAARRTVYHPLFSDLNSPLLYQDFDNFTAILGSGYQPGYLVRALLERRFDVVFLLAQDRERETDAGTGTWEDNYLWKLNEIMRAKYRPLRPVPRELRPALSVPAGVVRYRSPGVLERRPGPDPAPWMRHCFGPFRIAGESWRIVRGGGFWCRPGGRGDVLQMERTPAGTSEVRADDAGSPAGRALRVTLPGAGSFGVAGGTGDRAWTLTGRAGATGRVDLLLYRDGRILETVAPGGPLSLAFAGGSGAVRVGPGGRLTVPIPHNSGGPLKLRASRDSRASFDLSGLRLGGSRSSRRR